MLALVAVLALLVIGLSAFGLFRPRGYISLARWIGNGPGVLGAAAIRAGMAVVLWFAADASRTPTTFQVLAVITALGAVALPVLGQRRFERLIEWGAGQSPMLLQALSALGLGLGAFLLWSSTM